MILIACLVVGVTAYIFGHFRGYKDGFRFGKTIGKIRWKNAARLWHESVGMEFGKPKKNRRKDWPSTLEDE